MVHAKTDSEVTSIATSSPARSPRRPAYYVQSPSRDSHDGEKTSLSFHSTPILSPTASPPHSHSSLGHHSRESSTSRFSGKVTPAGGGATASAAAAAGRHKSHKSWKDCDVIEEEGLLEEDEDRPRSLIPRRCYFPLFVLAFLLLFFFFALILFGASQSQRPKVSFKSIKFENFVISAGTDASLVPTDLATLNSTVKMSFRNKGTFFGIHVTSFTLDLSYYELSLAVGNVKEFYQSRKSLRNLEIVVYGNKIPLYGGSASLSAPMAGKNGGAAATAAELVALTLRFNMRAKAYVLGRLVRPKFNTKIQCNVVMDQSRLNKAISLKNSCKID